MIVGTTKASPMNLCRGLVLLKTYQNIKRKCQKSELWRYNDVISKNNGRIRNSAKSGKLYTNPKMLIKAFQKCYFH